MKRHSKVTRGCLRAAVAAGAMLTPLIAVCPVRAADSDSPTLSDHELVLKLAAKVEQQDAEIRDLKAHQAASAPSTATEPAAVPTTAPASDDVLKRLAADEAQLHEMKGKVEAATASPDSQGPSYPTLQFHGFGDVDYHVSNRRATAGDTNANDAFTLGEFDVFLSSQLSPDIGVMSETVLSADNTNTYGIEIERLLLQFHPNENFNVDVGRYHSALGYYNTAFHHGTWFQTATGRPFFIEFEDSGGLLPVHQVGLSVHGAIPSGALGLNYFVEVGNGRQYQTPASSNNPVGNVFDDNRFKAVNIAFTSRPDPLPGLQFGAGFYHDTVNPGGGTQTDEVILHGHLIYKDADWEFLSEAYGIRHGTRGAPMAWSPMAYAQLGRKFGLWTPYVRFPWANNADSDLAWQVLQQVGRHYDTSVGVRYDISTFVALKAQYDYVVNSAEGYDLGPTFNPISGGSYSQVSLQAAFTY